MSKCACPCKGNVVLGKAVNKLRHQVAGLRSALRELLFNKTCSCGGWKCARCKLSIKDARTALRKS